jgi:hypothetical protein
MEIVAAPFDLDALVDTLRQLYGGLARDKGLSLQPGGRARRRAGGWATRSACARC